ncbi:MAG: EF-P lysine aminoacylase GenX [Alcanivoracaceae bacterium]|nr:EF-P lysine aminoacylase GenX [Alcanivoracaceae bacterium]
MTDWRPTASLAALQARASLYRQVRDFFQARNVLEVDTPALARHGVTDLHIDCIAVPGYGFLQSSPEYHMKRLLAAGSGSIYQISKVFRDGEAGKKHNPEFTLLEWYRTGFSLQQLIDESVALLQQLLSRTSVQQFSFRDIFRRVTGLDPLAASQQSLQDYAQQHSALPTLTKAELVDWLMACVVEKALPEDGLTVITDFPGWAAALAQTREDSDGEMIAERFEIYAGSLELANGYHELRDATEQEKRFAADQQLRAQHERQSRDADPHLLAALQHGLPDCSGVAIGLDRVLMAQLGAQTIAEVIPFPSDRA